MANCTSQQNNSKAIPLIKDFYTSKRFSLWLNIKYPNLLFPELYFSAPMFNLRYINKKVKVEEAV
jgi:hypothetical protein